MSKLTAELFLRICQNDVFTKLAHALHGWNVNLHVEDSLRFHEYTKKKKKKKKKKSLNAFQYHYYHYYHSHHH